MWQNPGFSYEDEVDFLVDKLEVQVQDYMNLGWRSNRCLDTQRSMHDWVRQHSDLLEADLPTVIESIRLDEDMPKRITDRLQLFVESDSYIKASYWRQNFTPKAILLISSDRKLALELIALSQRKANRTPFVCLVHPVIYMSGRTEEVLNHRLPLGTVESYNPQIIEDPGAIEFAQHSQMYKFDDEPFDPKSRNITEVMFDGQLKMSIDRRSNYLLCFYLEVPT